MNNLRSITVIMLFMSIFYLLLSSCKNDKNPTKCTNDMALVGQWVLTQMTSEYQGTIDTLTESQIDSMGIIWTLTFNDDCTAEQTTNFSGPLTTMPGTWETVENQLTLSVTTQNNQGGTITFEYVIHDDSLELNWELPAGSILWAELIKQ